MSTLEILLLVAGGLAFISSFFLPDGKKAQNAEISEEELRARVDEAIENSRARIDDMSEESIRYSMERTERALDKMTNEKMMALGEYSDTILNQIAQNHQETVFLHDMLNRSKDELTELLNRAERASKDADKHANDAYDLARNAEKLAEEVKERVAEYEKQAYAAEEKMIDARRMLQDMPVRREELSTQADALVRAVEEKQSREEAEQFEEIPDLDEDAYSVELSISEPELSVETKVPVQAKAPAREKAPVQADERSAYEELSDAFDLATGADAHTEKEYEPEAERTSYSEIPDEEIIDNVRVEIVSEDPKTGETLLEGEPEPQTEDEAEKPLSEEEKMERILQAAAAELAGERKRPLPTARRQQPAEEAAVVKNEAKARSESVQKPKAEPKPEVVQETQPVVEKHSAAAARALLESVSMSSPALGEDFASGKRPVAGERISRTSVKRKPRNSVRRTALSESVKGQMSIPEEFLSQKEAAKEAAPRAKESVSLQFAPGENSANHNERILQMHRMGRSNMAIAKDLGLGIGEVKLVIDLFENVG